MAPQTHGIHHVTAISGEPQRNADFYTGILGLRLVKKTVNFDDPDTYHLYYGDGAGSPGTIVTSFPIPATSLGYWTERLVEKGVRFEKPRDRFGETVLTFEDPDGLRTELVAADDGRPGWAQGPTPAEHSVRGLHHVALAGEAPERTAKL